MPTSDQIFLIGETDMPLEARSFRAGLFGKNGLLPVGGQTRN